MNVCGYSDIVYTEKHCPLCKANEEIRDLERENEDLGKRNNELWEIVTQLKADLDCAYEQKAN
jgi:cell division protein FtsB